MRFDAKLAELALDFLFPRRCVGCGRTGDFICQTCQESLPWLKGPVCPKCGRPQPGGILCSTCVSWQAAIDGIRSPLRFEGVIREAVHQLKYRNIRALAAPLAALLGDYLVAENIPAEALVPVPIHRKRLRERGYNQASLLAKELAKLTGLPVIDDCLVRQKYASPQARTLNVVERQRNVAGAFECVNRRLDGKQVLLIDDVSTSGATLDAAASAMKNAGAKSVWGLVLAREI
ncbi:MAG: ComF family protein [Chloroflexi bacterium]|nr:ComF family protein [Chloroflexota bacterium]